MKRALERINSLMNELICVAILYVFIVAIPSAFYFWINPRLDILGFKRALTSDIGQVDHPSIDAGQIEKCLKVVIYKEKHIHLWEIVS